MTKVEWQWGESDDSGGVMYEAHHRRYHLVVFRLKPNGPWRWHAYRSPKHAPVAEGVAPRSAMRAFREAEAALRQWLRKDQKR